MRGGDFWSSGSISDTRLDGYLWRNDLGACASFMRRKIPQTSPDAHFSGRKEERDKGASIWEPSWRAAFLCFLFYLVPLHTRRLDKGALLVLETTHGSKVPPGAVLMTTFLNVDEVPGRGGRVIAQPGYIGN